MKFAAACCLALVPFVLSPGAWSQGIRVGDIRVTGIGGDVRSHQTSSDSAHVVYRADQSSDERFELYRVAPGGGPVTQLNGALPAGGDVLDFVIAPDSSRVVYRADQDTDEVFELYSVPITGGTPVKLDATLAPAGDVSFHYAISSDSQRVVYVQRNAQDEAFSVPIAGGTPVRLNGTLPAGAGVVGIAISPDGTRVVYSADERVLHRRELFVVPITGGASVRLAALANGEDAGGLDGEGFAISPDGIHVVYWVESTVGPRRLYAVPIAGGPVAPLTGAIVAGGAVVAEPFAISPDSTHVVYRADADADQVLELYSAPIGGGAITKLNAPLIPAGDVEDYRIAPDASRVVYRADQDVDGREELFSVPLAGGPVTRLHLPGEVTLPGFEIVADSSAVVYRATPGNAELYSVPLAGGAPLQLSTTLAANREVLGAVTTPDASRVLYLADRDVEGAFQLFVAPLSGGASIALSGALVVGGDVQLPLVAPDSTRATYLADANVDEVVELFSTALTGGGSTRLNRQLAPGDRVGDVTQAALRPDGRALAFVADRDEDEVFELHGVLPLKSGPFRLSGPMPEGGDVLDFAFGPSGQRIAYRADQEIDGTAQLFSTNGGAPLRISGPPVDGEGVLPGYRFSKEGRIVYRQDVEGRVALFSAPVAQADAAVDLTPGVAALRQVTSFDVSNDGLRVVYVADPDVRFDDELYSVPLNGGPATKLNHPLAQGDVSGFRISPDSQRVVYLSNDLDLGQLRPYSVPIAGGPVVPLAGPEVIRIAPAGVVITPDSAHVVYVAYLDATTTEVRRVPIAGGPPVVLSGSLSDVGLPALSPDGQRAVIGSAEGLHSAPVDGSAPPVRLDAPAYQHTFLAISPDSAWVVYRSQPGPGEPEDIYSVPIAGGTPVRLNPLSPDGTGAVKAVVTRDSSRVIYLADPEGAWELFQAPIAGGPVRRVNAGLVEGGNVSSSLSPDGNVVSLGGDHVLYRADQDEDEIVELYLSFLTRPHQPVR